MFVCFESIVCVCGGVFLVFRFLCFCDLGMLRFSVLCVCVFALFVVCLRFCVFKVWSFVPLLCLLCV